MDIEVLIPAMEGRERYLAWCIKSCLVQQHDSFGILVSNNGGALSIRDTVSSFGDPRIRYVETNQLLPMCEHWEFMLSHAKGDFLTIIGDDDALMPNALLTVKNVLFEYPGVLCVTHEPAQYYWPDYPVEILKNRYVCRKRTGTRRITSAGETFKRVVEFREWYGKLPFLYHGFVSRQVLERIKKDMGGIFLRPAPDIFSDLLLGLYLDSYVQIENCLTVGGQGAKSTGASCAVGADAGKSFVESHSVAMRPKYSIASITLQVFEYVEFIDTLCANPIKKNLDWGQLFRTVTHEGLLAQNEALSRQVFCDLQNIITQYCDTIQRWPLFFFAGLIRSTPVLQALRKWQLGRRQQLDAGMNDAKRDFGAENVFDFSKALNAAASKI